ncbi:class I SAM-dependent methyltransferase [Cellulomonas sp. SG140]|uniref:class I SAM-dependent methyltransferase n=1 Tax=Cellulomonas sp. SG140 TaxID=2976536 RepID=UPI0021E8B680|nr:class I SAM-dependent methyltransferase [Cellulomonas sp. SG140]
MTTDRPAHPGQPSGPAAPGPAQPAADDPDADRRARRCAALAAHIRLVLGDGHHRRGLDIGSGAGGVSPHLVDLFDEQVLLDVDGDALALAHANVSAAVTAAGCSTRVRTARVDLSTAEGAPHAGDLAPLDVAFSAMALHHVRDVPRLLRTVAGLLRPGGRLVVADLEPDGGLYHADRPSFDGHDGFSHEQISSWCVAAGLHVDQLVTAYVDPKPVRGTVRHLPVFVAAATRLPG